jgi:hypothetical protein
MRSKVTSHYSNFSVLFLQGHFTDGHFAPIEKNTISHKIFFSELMYQVDLFLLDFEDINI